MITDKQAENLVVRMFKNEHICDNELDDFDDWKFEHSTNDVAELIKSAGKTMNTTYPESVTIEREYQRQRDECRKELNDLREYAKATVEAYMSGNNSIVEAAIVNLNNSIKRTTY
jgi:hypothetical protein